jgi:predicted AAA+ superfamily ATPase
MNFQEPLSGLFERIARAVERLGPREPDLPDFEAADAFVWQAETESFQTVKAVNRVPLSLLKGIDGARDTLLANTLRFARGLPANNALLWGARGTGKSSLVKAVHGKVAGLKLVEIHREDIASLPRLLGHLRGR